MLKGKQLNFLLTLQIQNSTVLFVSRVFAIQAHYQKIDIIEKTCLTQNHMSLRLIKAILNFY